jgi:hypothetical protein
MVEGFVYKLITWYYILNKEGSMNWFQKNNGNLELDLLVLNLQMICGICARRMLLLLSGCLQLCEGSFHGRGSSECKLP